MPIASMFPGGGGAKDIAKAVITLGPVLAYTGKEQIQSIQSVVLDGATLMANTDYVVINNVGTNAGDYVLAVVGIEKYCGVVSRNWKIARVTVSAFPNQMVSLTFNGGIQSPTWNGYNALELTISGTTSASNAGSYTAIFTPTINYQWADGTTAAKNAVWQIGKLSLTKPTVNGSRTYTGSSQEVPLIGFDVTYMSKGGGYYATNAGSYTALIALVNTANLQWADGTIAEFSLGWTMNKAQGTLSVSPTTLVLSGAAGKTGTTTITKIGDGTITVMSSDTAVATASISGLTITGTSVETGSATFTVTMADSANYLGASTTISVTVTIIDLYGVVWNYGITSTALTRLTEASDPNGYVTAYPLAEPLPAVGTGTGSSPFDAVSPWRDMEEYNFIDRAVSTKMGESGFSRTANDTVVKIPMFYYKIVDDATNTKRYFYVSNAPVSGFDLHPGSDKYVGKYNTIAGYASKSGSAPLTAMTRASARSGSKEKGTGWYQWDIATLNAIKLLYIIEFADWDSQSKVGRGVVDSSTKINTGSTDSMTYHTGRADGTNGETQVMYRWIEGLWGNIWGWVDGINESADTLYICTDPAKYADDTATNYTMIKFQTAYGWIKKLGYDSGASWFLCSSSGGGSDSTYVPDSSGASPLGWCAVYASGLVKGGSSCGLFYVGYNSASTMSGNIGSRLIFIP